MKWVQGRAQKPQGPSPSGAYVADLHIGWRQRDSTGIPYCIPFNSNQHHLDLAKGCTGPFKTSRVLCCAHTEYKQFLTNTYHSLLDFVVDSYHTCTRAGREDKKKKSVNGIDL